SFLSAGARFGRVAWKAGSNPKSSAVQKLNAAVNPKMRQSGVVGIATTLLSSGAARTKTAHSHVDNNSASAPLVAPSDNRTAISFWRLDARVIKRFATFTQAISSSTPTIASRIEKGLASSEVYSVSPFDASIRTRLSFKYF